MILVNNEKLNSLNSVSTNDLYILTDFDGTITKDNSDSAWIAWYGILKEYREQGLGRELLQSTINLAASMGFKWIRLYTDFIDYQNAIHLYEKEGFVGEKYTFEKLAYDCRIYSKSLTDDNIQLWNNKNLNLGYQSELDHMNDDKIKDIVKIYENILKR